jgi:hypothetical protein
MTGIALLKSLISSTGLPAELVEGEINRLLNLANIKAEELTIEDLRAVLSVYMQDILLEAKKEYS